LCFCVVLVLAGCGGQTWSTHDYPVAGFSADFPGEVTQPQGIEKSGAGGPQTYHFECRTPNRLTYQVTFTAQHNSAEQIAARLDELEKQKLPADSRYTSLKTNRIQLGGDSGIEQVYLKETKEYGNSFMRVRTFILPQGDYYLTVDSQTSTDAYSPDVERFLNSFKSSKIDATK
jgi:hypothetical protein